MSLFSPTMPSRPTPMLALQQPSGSAVNGWLALSVVALLIVAALAAGVIYAVSIDRAVNGNLQHNSDQLPPETPTAKGEKARPAKASGTAVNYVLMGPTGILVSRPRSQ